MTHSDTSALNASGVKGIDVGATATAAGCSGKTQLHGDLSFVFLRPADQKLWVFEDFEALKLLFRGRSRPFKSIFEIYGVDFTKMACLRLTPGWRT